MDFYNYNGNNKRKFSKSIEQKENSKRKNIQNDETVSCFRKCCMRKKYEITSINKERIVRTSVGKNPLKTSLSPMSIGRFDTILNRRISGDGFGGSCDKEKSTDETFNSLKNNVNSFINEIIGDGVDRMSELMTMRSTDRNRQERLRTDTQLSTNSENNFQNDGLMRSLSDLEKSQQNLGFIKQQHQYPELVFEKQNLEKTSQKSDRLAIDFPLDNSSLHINPDDDSNRNLVSNETNFDQEKESDKSNSLQDQEPYNWDYQEYQWLSPLDSSEKKQSSNKFMNNISKQSSINDKDGFLSDDENTDRSYSIASVLPTNKRKKSRRSSSNDLKNSTPSLNILNQQETFSTSEFRETVDGISDHRNQTEYKICLNQSKDLRQPNSLSNLSSTIKSTYSSQFNHDKLQALDRNSRNEISLSQNLPNLSSKIFPKHKTQQQNDRWNATSVSDLFTHANKQKALELDSNSTVYLVSISEGLSVSLEGTTERHDKNHAHPSQTALTEKHLLGSSNIETKQLKNIINMDTKEQTRPIDKNLVTKRTRSHLTDTQENQQATTETNNTFHQVHSTYDDILSAWRHLLECLFDFMLPSNDNSDLSPSNTHSWSTSIPTETLNITQYDSIGPWWGRRDIHDRTPATFIFANESLSTSYSMETITNNKQMCMSLENRPYWLKYYSYSNTCRCCCSSSITINNNSSSS